MSLENKTILFVEDSPDLRLLMFHVLGKIGFKNRLFAESFEQVKNLGDSALKSDFALLDINLGADVPNGIEIYDWLMANNYQGRIALLTGYSSDDSQIQDIVRKAKVPILAKPIEYEALTDFIKGAL